MSKTEGKIFSFRLDGELVSKLNEAAERTGLSPHEWLKRAAIRELNGLSNLPKLALQNEAIKQELIELRKDIAVATEGILVSAGKATNEQASRFVKANLKGN